MDGLEASLRQERRCSAAKKENKWKYTYCVYKVGGLTFCLYRKQESQVTINSRYMIGMWKPWIGCLLVYAHEHGIILN